MKPLQVDYSASALLRTFKPVMFGAAGMAGLCFVAWIIAKTNGLSFLQPIALAAGAIPLAILLLMLLVYCKLASRKGTAIEFSEAGITHKRGNWPVIPWDEIARLEIQRVSNSPFLAIYPKTAFPAQIKIDPCGAATFGIDGFSHRTEEIIAWLEEHQPGLLT